MPFIIVAMLLCIVAAVFSLQNALVVPVRFIFIEQEASLALVILGSVFLGFLLGTVFTMYIKFKNFWAGRKKQEIIKELTDENLLLSKNLEEMTKQLEEKTGVAQEPAGKIKE